MENENETFFPEELNMYRVPEIQNLEEYDEDELEELFEDDYYDIPESEIVDCYEYLWDEHIACRGKDYYKSDRVLSVYKTNGKYIAKVKGSREEPYTVEIKVDYGEHHFNCTCPYEDNCKHEFAVLLAIQNGDYKEVKLKENVKENKLDFNTLMDLIPAEEIKKYLMSLIKKDHIIFERNKFEEYFSKYLPIQKYDYYYNNLYNSLLINEDYDKLTNNYIRSIQNHIADSNFKESFKIIKAIIETYNDADFMDFGSRFIDILPSLGMFLRVSYRKSKDTIREEIETWINYVKNNNYYNNFYLEDILLSIK